MTCTSCKRTGEKCSFCRIPMKRGPSKGQRRESSASTVSNGSAASEKSSTTSNNTAGPNSKEPVSPGTLVGPPPLLPSETFRKRAFSSSASSTAAMYPHHNITGSPYSHPAALQPLLHQHQHQHQEYLVQNQDQNQNPQNLNTTRLLAPPPPQQALVSPTRLPSIDFITSTTTGNSTSTTSEPTQQPQASVHLPPWAPVSPLTAAPAAPPLPPSHPQINPPHLTHPAAGFPNHHQHQQSPYYPAPHPQGPPNSLPVPDAAHPQPSFSGQPVVGAGGGPFMGPHHGGPLPLPQMMPLGLSALGPGGPGPIGSPALAGHAEHTHHQPPLLRSGYSSRSNSVPSYLPSDAMPLQLGMPMPMPPAPISLPLQIPIPMSMQDDNPKSPKMQRLSSPQPSQTTNLGATHMDALAAAAASSEEAQGWPNWQDRHIDSYYQIVHPTLPILPSSKPKLRAFLARSSNIDLRGAVLAGVNALAWPSNGSGSNSERAELLGAVARVAQSSGGLVSEELDAETRQLYMVCLLLLYLGTGEAMWLSGAVSIAYSLEMHLALTQNQREKEEEEEAVAQRRLFLVLVVLDTLNSASKYSPPFIPNTLINFNVDRDAACFGAQRTGGAEIVKLCILLRHVCQAATSQSAAVSTEPLYKELDAARSDIEGMWDTVPVLKALYNAVLVSIYNLQITSSPSSDVSPPSVDHQNRLYLVCFQTVSTLNDLATLMVSPLISVSPLMGYFYGVVGDAACKVVEVLPKQGVYFKCDSDAALDGASSPQLQGVRHTEADIVALRSQTLDLLAYLQGSASQGSFVGAQHSALLKKMDSILRETRERNGNRNQEQMQLSPKSTAYHSQNRSVSPTDARLLQSLRGSPPRHPHPQHTQGQSPNQAQSQGITMMATTSHSALEKLASVADKVKLFI